MMTQRRGQEKRTETHETTDKAILERAADLGHRLEAGDPESPDLALEFMSNQAIELMHEIDAADTDAQRLELAMELIQLYQRMFHGAVKQTDRALESADRVVAFVEDVHLFYAEPGGSA